MMMCPNLSFDTAGQKPCMSKTVTLQEKRQNLCFKKKNTVPSVLVLCLCICLYKYLLLSETQRQVLSLAVSIYLLEINKLIIIIIQKNTAIYDFHLAAVIHSSL